ncbi:hypothetical protein M747DRAFT_325614 [Aspergillus niger ATCC 13496]|uniref:Rhodopsin domain-containing protein n=1 Tax=Aspergillus niger ATCC 13496 TaxID=1353008 RepID=A0A370BQ33_ASPNG|nr:hypothetical protein M747DRAFT_325614 [Aspergillus niger ATCC 13496]
MRWKIESEHDASAPLWAQTCQELDAGRHNMWAWYQIEGRFQESVQAIRKPCGDRRRLTFANDERTIDLDIFCPWHQHVKPNALIPRNASEASSCGLGSTGTSNGRWGVEFQVAMNARSDPDIPYNGDALIGVSVAIAVVQIVVVVARFYTRRLQQLALALDDYLILLALIASLGQSALYIILVKLAGVGHHMEYVEETPEKLVILEKGLYANEILDFPFTVTPAKISILVFYLRIFTTRSFKNMAYIVGAIVLGHGLGILFAAIFQCWPIAYVWDTTIEGGSCFNQLAFYRYVSPPNILTDVLLLIMPLPYVWKLHTRKGQKLALTGVFLLGSLKCHDRPNLYVLSVHIPQRTPTRANHINSGTSTNLGIWTILEGGIIIIAACLPPIWPLIMRILPQQLRSKGSSQTPQCYHRRYPTNQGNAKTPEGFSRLGDNSQSRGSHVPSLGSQTMVARESEYYSENISLEEAMHGYAIRLTNVRYDIPKNPVIDDRSQ